MGVKYKTIVNTESLSLCKHPDKEEYWLWDKVLQYNVAMNEPTERDAFIKTIEKYQKRLLDVEQKYKTLQNKVDVFVEQFTEEE